LGAFGEKLRKQREQRGLALDAISNTTKISTRMLRALEDEHFDQLPGGVFNKGFVRAYARQVGLDEEEALADYLLALRESQIQQQSILPDFRAQASKQAPPDPRLKEPRETPRKDDGRDDSHLRSHDLANKVLRNKETQDQDQDQDQDQGKDKDKEIREKQAPIDEAHRQDRRKTDQRNQNQNSIPADVPPRLDPPPTRAPKYPAGDPVQSVAASPQIPWSKLAIALLVIALALALWNLRRHGYLAAASRPAVATQTSPGPVPPATTQNSTSLNSGPPSTAANHLAGTAPAAQTSQHSQIPDSQVTTSAIVPTAVAPAPAPSKAPPAPSSAATSANAATALPKKPAPPTSKPLPTFTVLIRAEKTTWVQITSDGKPVAHETLIAPAHTSVRATREIVVKAGNAAGISFQLNGKEIPAQGAEGEVKTYVFDPSTVRVQPQTQAAPNR